MANFFDKSNSEKVGNFVVVLGLVVGLFFGMKFINQVKEFSVIGMTPRDVSTIDVSGLGEITATPDTATISFTVEAHGKNVESTQAMVAKKMNTALDFLKESKIDDKDIKTANYNSYPEYTMPCGGRFPCSDTSVSKVSGYITSENVSVKIHDVASAGAIIDGLGEAGITGISGPDFSVADMDTVRTNARAKAIDDAKTKASLLAKQLGVKLGRIVRFNDGGNSPVPMMYMAKAEIGTAGSEMRDTALPTGENKYTSNVTITYEIIQ